MEEFLVFLFTTKYVLVLLSIVCLLIGSTFMDTKPDEKEIDTQVEEPIIEEVIKEVSEPPAPVELSQLEKFRLLLKQEPPTSVSTIAAADAVKYVEDKRRELSLTRYQTNMLWMHYTQHINKKIQRRALRNSPLNDVLPQLTQVVMRKSLPDIVKGESDVKRIFELTGILITGYPCDGVVEISW